MHVSTAGSSQETASGYSLRTICTPVSESRSHLLHRRRMLSARKRFVADHQYREANRVIKLDSFSYFELGKELIKHPL